MNRVDNFIKDKWVKDPCVSFLMVCKSTYFCLISLTQTCHNLPIKLLVNLHIFT